MRQVVLIGLLVALAGPALAERRALPAEVWSFMRQRDRCDHARGEDPADAARARQLTAALRRDCTGTDAALRDLRRRHRANPAVQEALRGYDDAVE